MKSFFKKLAFVMALAMVVSLAAPAAKSALATTEFTYAYQEGGQVTALNMKANDEVDLRFIGVKDYKNYTLEWVSSNPAVAKVDQSGNVTAVADKGTAEISLKVGDGTVYTSTPVKVTVGEAVKVVLGTAKDNTFTSYTLEMGETVDLNFYGVPNFSVANYTCTWVSSAPEVVRVDSKGIVTPVAAGTAVVTVAIVNNITGDTLTVVPVEVTVPEEKEDTSYSVVQVSANEAKIVFNSELAVTGNISLVRVYDGDIEVAWPLETIAPKDNTVSIKPYVAFGDGDKYIVRVNGETEGTAFTTKVGRPDRIEISYKSLGKDGKAYTNGEDGEQIVVSLTAKLYSGLVDVTSVYDPNGENVVFTLKEDSEYCYMLDEYEGTMEFTKPISVTVLATYTYYDEAADKDIDVTSPGKVECELAPAYKITGIQKWTIVEKGKEDKIDWSKPVHDMAAYDDNGNYYIIALVEDNYGNVVAVGGANTYANSDLKIQKFSGSRMEQEGYYVEFSSANDEKLLVGSNGTVTTYIKANVPAIVSLYNSDSDRVNPFVRNLSALPITVKEQRTLGRLTVDSSAVNVLTAALDAEFAKETVKISAKDQYQEKDWPLSASDLVITCSDENVVIGNTDLKEDNGSVIITLDGAYFKSVATKTSLTFTVKEKDSNKTTSFRVSLRNPSYYDHDNNKETPEKINVTKYELSVSDVDQYIKEAGKGDNKTNTKNATINFYGMSGSYPVVYQAVDKVLTSKEALTIATDDATGIFLGDGTEVKVEDQLLVVTDPNGAVVSNVVKAADGKYTIAVATDNGNNGKMSYMPTGRYTVKILTVKASGGKHVLRAQSALTDYFTVSNTSAGVSLNKQTDLDVTDNDIVPTNAADVVVAALKFNLGGSEWKALSSGMIQKVNGRYNAAANRIVVTSVVFNVPLDGKTVAGPYYQVTVPVNKAIEVSGKFDATTLNK